MNTQEILIPAADDKKHYVCASQKMNPLTFMSIIPFGHQQQKISFQTKILIRVAAHMTPGLSSNVTLFALSF